MKWATQNVGASSLSDYGGYYAWGETRTKSSYDWSNYFDCLDSTGGSWGTYKIGGKTSISPTSGHDIARENWGGTWRMPTDAELEELCKNAIGHGHPKTVIMVIRLLVLTARVSSFLLLAFAAVRIRPPWVGSSTGRVCSVRRTPAPLVTCYSLTATTARATASVAAV